MSSGDHIAIGAQLCGRTATSGAPRVRHRLRRAVLRRVGIAVELPERAIPQRELTALVLTPPSPGEQQRPGLSARAHYCQNGNNGPAAARAVVASLNSCFARSWVARVDRPDEM